MTALPPLTFGLVLLFWGWQSGHWLPAIAAALWLEWAVRTSLRWNLSHKSIERIVDLTSLVLLAIVLYRYADGPFADDPAAAHAAVHRRAHEHPSRAAGRRPLYCEVPR